MSCSLCYVKSRIYFLLLVFFKHAFMRLLSVSGIYKLIQSCCCLHLQLIDSSQVELLLVGLFCNFEHFCFAMCFVTDCQMGNLIGSKELGANVLELQCVMLENHDQNIQSIFRLLEACFGVKLESSVLQDLLYKSAKLDRTKIRLD